MATVLDRGLERDTPVELADFGARARRRRTLRSAALYVLLIGIALFFILPMLFVFSTSFKVETEVFTDPGLIPADPGLENYRELLTGASTPFYRWFLNSSVVSVVGTVLTVVLTSFSAYAFARIDFPLKTPIFSLLITTLLLPSVMFLVPQYKLIGQIGLYDTLPGLMLPGLAGVFGVFFMRQFFLTLPRELEEAAVVDGCNLWQIFWRVLLPLTRPALVTLGLLAFLTNYNDFLWPVYVLFSPETQTLPAGLSTLQSANNVRYDLLMAGAVVASLPVLVLYVFAQRFVIEGVSRSGLKG